MLADGVPALLYLALAAVPAELGGVGGLPLRQLLGTLVGNAGGHLEKEGGRLAPALLEINVLKAVPDKTLAAVV